MSEIPLEAGAYYIFDRAYNFFEQLFRIDAIGAYFVVRAKKNLKYKVVRWKRRMPQGVLSDSMIELTGYASNKHYPKTFRRVVYFDQEQNRELTFISNAMDISALEVALLYKNRWSVELFVYDKLHIMQSSDLIRIDIQSITRTTSCFNFA